MGEDVSHRDIIKRVDELGESCGALSERLVKVEERQSFHAEIAEEVRDDVKDIKKSMSRMLGFGAGIAATISVLWAGVIAAWELLRRT